MRGLLIKYRGTIAFILLLTVALVMLFSRRDGTLSKRTRNFSPDNLSGIDKIVISQMDDAILLERNDQVWRLNGVAAARKDRVELLMASLERIEIVSPVSKEVEKNICEHLVADGKLVQLFVRGNLDKAFRVYYDATGIKGTYMMLDKSEDPFMVRLKGYSGVNIENIFTMDLRSWRENSLFDLGPDEIQEVVVEYPAAMGKSYRIFRSESGGLILADMSATTPVENTDLQEMADYLFFFSNIHFEYPETAIPDTMLSGIPFATLRVTNIRNQVTDLKGYRLPAYRDESDEYNISQFIGLTGNDQDTVILNYAEMDPIFRQLEDFQKK